MEKMRTAKAAAPDVDNNLEILTLNPAISAISVLPDTFLGIERAISGKACFF